MGCFTSSQDTSLGIPEWMKGQLKTVGGAAMKQLGQKYQPYKGEMVAGMTGTQSDAMSTIKKMLGQGFDTPRLIDNIPGTGHDKGTIKDYMNPYTDEVLDPTLRNIRQQNAQAMQGVDQRANFTGGFRDSGSAIQRAMTEKLGSQAIGDATSQAYSNAYNSAMGLRNMDINRLMQNRQDELGAAGQQFQMGTQQQATQQSRDTANFSEFLRKQGFDLSNIGDVSKIIANLIHGTPMTTTTTGSTAGQIGGLMGGIGGLLGGLF